MKSLCNYDAMHCVVLTGCYSIPISNIHLVMNTFGTLFPDKIFSLTFPWLLTKSQTFPWHVSNSLTFPGFPDKWSLWLWPRLLPIMASSFPGYPQATADDVTLLYSSINTKSMPQPAYILVWHPQWPWLMTLSGFSD